MRQQPVHLNQSHRLLILQRHSPTMCIAQRTRCPERHTTYTVLKQCSSANIKLPHYDKKMCMRPDHTEILDNDTASPSGNDSPTDGDGRRDAAYQRCSHWQCRKRCASSWVCEDVSQTRRSITVHLVRPSLALWEEQTSEWQRLNRGSGWYR